MKEPTPKEFTKQKATQKEPHKKQVVKKACLDTQKASTATASESVAKVPPSLIIRLSSQKETPKEAAQVPGKLDFLHIILLHPFFFASAINYFIS